MQQFMSQPLNADSSEKAQCTLFYSYHECCNHDKCYKHLVLIIILLVLAALESSHEAHCALSLSLGLIFFFFLRGLNRLNLKANHTRVSSGFV